MRQDKCFLHVDIDAFFASVEQLDHPEWKGKPVVVGGLPGEPRSVVSTASYEARKFGIHSAMPVSQAYRLCPDAIFTHGSHKRYSELSLIIMNILKNYSPDFHQISIDEACIDITGTELLFGSPDVIGAKIRREIKEATGLTVSAGIAPTRYLSKLASEVNKPDGLYRIHNGEEIQFMQNLPLAKVWGIGKKTLERLNKAGIYTTRQIYEQDERLLKSMFGDSMGSFLYNTVRARETEPKSEPTRSISAETTFPVDIYDSYIAETCIMELCHNIMFRLKNEKSKSRTVMIKLRYDDFTTISARATGDDFITSLDDLFERAKNLFEKKYEKGRGIRLLGAGAENLMDENSAVQEVLFDFGEKKKKAVEDAILSLTNKNPDIKVKKARLLTSAKKNLIVLLVLGSLFGVVNQKITAQETENQLNASGAAALNSETELLPVPVEASKTLWTKEFGKNNLEFIMKGWWQGQTTFGAEATYDEDDGFSPSWSTPVFKQQVDMSMWLMLNRQWYFEAAAADEFEKNTVAMGFYGKAENPLKEVRIANRGIIFPSGYSMDCFNRSIGGGQNQAPGIQAHFADPDAERNRWHADFALRYDMTETHSATFYGKNAVNTTVKSPSDYITGQFFVLPEESGLISQIKSIYVESSSGSYKDRYGRSFSRLAEDTYITIHKTSQLIISKDAGTFRKNGKTPAVIIEFSREPKAADFGSYEQKSTFLGKIQEHFGSSADLKKFSYELLTEINGHTALLIQNSSGFSPFACAQYYDCGISEKTDVMIGSSTTCSASAEYSAGLTDDFESLSESAFFSGTHKYAKIYLNNESQTAEIKPQDQFPLAEKHPGFYLGYPDNTDLSLLIQKYSPVKNYNIGTKASQGSVKVYRNAILDTNASYDSESGIVTISGTASDLDKIYITWEEDTGSSDNGAISAQAGAAFSILPCLKADFVLAANWTVKPFSNYAEYSRSQGGYAAASTGIEFKKETVTLSNAVAATVENPNVTGLYRVLGMDDATSQTYYLEKSSGFILNGIVPDIENLVLKSEDDGTQNEEDFTGFTDSAITGYKIPLEWNFTDEDKTNWASVNVKLNAGNLLPSASEFRVAIKNESANFTDYDLYLQLGTEAGKDVKAEYSEKIPVWNITDSNESSVITHFNPQVSGWQIIRITLTDSDRSRLQSFHDMRLTAVSKKAGTGIISAGPYEIISRGIFTSESEKLFISSEQKKDRSIPSCSTFNSDDNYVQEISWIPEESSGSAAEYMITAAKYFPEADLANYRTFNFYYKFSESARMDFTDGLPESEEYFSIILDRESTGIEENGKPALYAVISKTGAGLLRKNKNFWHKFTVDLSERAVYIDGIKIPEEDCLLYINTGIIPSRFKIRFSSIDTEEKKITGGVLALDELHLEETAPYVLFQDIAELKLEKKDVILEKNGIPLVEDALFYTKQTVSAVKNTEDYQTNSSSLVNRTTAQITLASIKFKAETELSSTEYQLLSSASHEISTVRPLFKILEFSDRFIFDHSSTSFEKFSEAKISLRETGIPLKLSGKTSSTKSRWNFGSEIECSAQIFIDRRNWNADWKTSVKTAQKSQPETSEVEDFKDKNYFTGYLEQTKDSFSSGLESASKRSVEAQSTLNLKFMPADFSPALTFTTKENYSNSNTAKYTDSITLSNEFPFSLKGQHFSFKHEKSGGGNEFTEKGGDFYSDTGKLWNHLGEHDFVFRTIPFYELFQKNLSSMISDSQDDDTNYLEYKSEYSFNWKRIVFADIRDLFIPSNFRFSTQRSVIVSDSGCDNYILKASVMNTPFNILGRNSSLCLFKWYDTDEFIISFTGTVKIPAEEPEDTVYSLSAYAQTGIYINQTDLIRFGADIQIQTDESWSSKFSARYKRNAGKTPVEFIYRPIIKKFKIENPSLTRTDYLDISLSYSDEKFTQSYEAGHKIEIAFQKYFSMNTGITAGVSHTTDKAVLMLLSGTIGGKLTF